MVLSGSVFVDVTAHLGRTDQVDGCPSQLNIFNQTRVFEIEVMYFPLARNSKRIDTTQYILESLHLSLRVIRLQLWKLPTT